MAGVQYGPFCEDGFGWHMTEYMPRSSQSSMAFAHCSHPTGVAPYAVRAASIIPANKKIVSFIVCFIPCLFVKTKNHRNKFQMVRRLTTIIWVVCLFSIFAALLTIIKWTGDKFVVIKKAPRARIYIRRIWTGCHTPSRENCCPWHGYYKLKIQKVQ